jgi:hypothetical protein
MGSDGRGPDGRFKPGHHFAKGSNGLARRVQLLRSALLAHVTPEDIGEIVRVLLEKAKAGDVVAIRELLNRSVGKPVAPVELVGPDGDPVPGLTMSDVQLAVIEALADEPRAKVKVAQKLRELHVRAGQRTAGNGTPA